MIDHIRIVDITNDPERGALMMAQNSEEWRGSLTPEQHAACEDALGGVLAAEGMPTRRWALETRVSQSGDWKMVCSLVTLKRPAYLKVKSSKPRLTHNYVLDLVFTPQEHRGKGYARKLVADVTRQLAEEARTNGQPALISLWSDVGDYYSRCGYRPAPRRATEIIAKADPDAKWPEPASPEDFCEPLNAEQSRMSVDYGRAAMLSAIDIMTEKDGQARVIVSPTSGVLKHNQWRSEYTCSVLGIEGPTVYGARTPNGWAVWAYSLSEKQLSILAISGPILEMVSLFQAAVACASPHGFKVVMYEDDLVFVDQPITSLLLNALEQAGVQFQYQERKHSLPYYLTADGGLCNVHDVRLEFAGKYSYF